MRFTNPGPNVSSEDIARFERWLGASLPDQFEWFLKTVVNGGRPAPHLSVPVYGHPNEEFMLLNGLYGIDHPEETYDLISQIRRAPKETAIYGLPLGFDGMGGELLFPHRGPHEGQVRYVPEDEYNDPNSSESYLVAPDLKGFAKVLEEAWQTEVEARRR